MAVIYWSLIFQGKENCKPIFGGNSNGQCSKLRMAGVRIAYKVTKSKTKENAWCDLVL